MFEAREGIRRRLTRNVVGDWAMLWARAAAANVRTSREVHPAVSAASALQGGPAHATPRTIVNGPIARSEASSKSEVGWIHRMICR